MKQTSKRLQALVLVLAMCVSFLQIPSFAADATGHTYVVTGVTFDKDGNYTAARKCTAEGHDEEVVSSLTGKADSSQTTPATCTKEGTIVYTVTLDSKPWTSDPIVVEAKKAHTLKPVTEVTVPATCTEGGKYRVNQVCSVCNAVEYGTEQDSAALGHDYNEKGVCTRCGAEKETPVEHKHVAGKAAPENDVPASCTTDGSYDLVTRCTDCGEIISSEHKIVPAHHTKGKTEEKNKVDSTCVKEGSYDEVTYCAVCNKEMSVVTKTIAKKDHIKPATPVYENDTATCQQAGTKDAVYYCAVCKAEMERKTVSSDKKAHNPAAPVKENVVEATCTKEGSFDSVVYCTAGKEEISREHVTVPKAKHKSVPTFVWDKSTELFDDETPYCEVIEKCAVCGLKGDTLADAWGNDLTVKEDTTKFVAQEFPCQPGSKTFVATYKYIDENNKEVTLTDTKAYAYYKDYDLHHHKDGAAQIENVVEPTCSKNGSYDVVVRCTVCNEVLASTPLVIGKTGNHTAAAAKKENVVAATTKKGGSYDLVTRCADCGKVLSKTHKTTAKIVVKASKVTKATNVKGKKAKITVKKAASVTGYQIQYGTKKNFKGAKSVKTKATTKTLTKLTKNKKYYVRVRTYKVVSGKTYYSSWSGYKTVTIKK